jgi:hypothetical protein
MGHLDVLSFADGLVKVGHANDSGNRVLSPAAPRQLRLPAASCGAVGHQPLAPIRVAGVTTSGRDARRRIRCHRDMPDIVDQR